MAFASKAGAGPKPRKPMSSSPEEWSAYRSAMRIWYGEVKRILQGHRESSALKYRTVRDYCEQFGVKHDYQLYPHIIDGGEPPAAHLQQALFKAYQQALSATVRGAAPPQPKKRDQDVLLQTGSGACFRTGSFGSRPGMPNGRQDWRNCAVKLPGVGWISGRLGSEQPLEAEEFWVEGVSLRREADGWYASIRQHIVPKIPPAAGNGVCAIDVGLVELFAAVGDDGETLLASNPRKGESMRRRRHTPHGYIELIAIRQAAGLPTSILQARSARNIRQIVRQYLFPFCDRYETILIEDLPSDIGFRNTPHLSFMRTIRSMLIDRYGSERCTDRDCTNSSRECSMCGESQTRSWSELPGRIGKCPHCGHQEHSDLNAARNLIRKYLKP